jgi:hypothetical protein
MNSNRIWAFGTAVVVVAVVALGYILGISPKLAEVAASEASLQAVRAQNAQHQAELISLREQFEHIDELEAQLEDLQVAIPADVGLPEFIRQLNTLAASTHVRIVSISAGLPTTFAGPQVPGTMLNDDGEVVPLPDAPPNLITIGFTIKLTGPAGAIQNFTDGLQKGDRLFFVRGVVINAVETKASEGVEASTSFEGEVDGYAFALELPQSAS